jgi:deazaflavin-dependent oxidoreductase (nitroreductase family)
MLYIFRQKLIEMSGGGGCREICPLSVLNNFLLYGWPSMFKAFWRVMLSIVVWMYRRTNGKIGGRMQGLPVLLLTTTGRKTGKKRVTPLSYFEHDGNYVIIASNAGFDTHPAWYHNLKSQPQVEVQIRDKQLTAIGEPASPALRGQLWAKLVERAPGYRAYEKRTIRVIPIVLLQPISQT